MLNLLCYAIYISYKIYLFINNLFITILNVILELCLQPKFITIITWYLLAQYIFYGTSHQPTIMQIDWHAAFVGRSAKYDHSNFISAILILLNTFGGQILYYILYPLIILFPSCLYGLLPMLIPTQGIKIGKIPGSIGIYNIVTLDATKNEQQRRDTNVSGSAGDDGDYYYDNAEDQKNIHKLNYHNFDIQRGELTLYENKNIFFAALFKLACQLLLLQGVRVSDIQYNTHNIAIYLIFIY